MQSFHFLFKIVKSSFYQRNFVVRLVFVGFNSIVKIAHGGKEGLESILKLLLGYHITTDNFDLSIEGLKPPLNFLKLTFFHLSQFTL